MSPSPASPLFAGTSSQAAWGPDLERAQAVLGEVIPRSQAVFTGCPPGSSARADGPTLGLRRVPWQRGELQLLSPAARTEGDAGTARAWRFSRARGQDSAVGRAKSLPRQSQPRSEG
ncbi:unnamed protein product [Lepidochelys olivacea]